MRMVVASLLFFAASTTVADTQLKPYDEAIRMVGRFDGRDPAGPKISWPATGAEIHFRGTSVRVTLKETNLDRWHDWIQVFVDGVPTRAIRLEPGTQTIELTDKLAGREHTIRFAKRTEPFCGTVQLLGATIVDGVQFRPIRPKRRIEVIGDSISCGFGNLASKATDTFTDATEDATQAYGALAANDLTAEYICHAWSGRTMDSTNTIPEIYDLTVPTDKTSKGPEDSIKADAIVIHLGTNDFGRTNPDEASWSSAYKAFVTRIRQTRPKAMIYAAIGSMMTDNWPRGNKALTTIRSYVHKIVDDLTAAGDKRIRFIEFDEQNAEIDGLGASYHPNVATHRKMATKLVAAIRRDLNWK